ncbi:hypothetical protein K491DRAFT_734654 [Lophiostoma macrostomum CBS 122681]|uniref:Uncharacterized protein n=1 Tax=Lophiostoma macrostomum CBS 122681 TaxID=1314788 RepID=A0A6A6SPM6_9PLEO|nr:hypothetical protein K491DRAFT_734654 [Lophiostoma macrostomum CBS 122681]
MPTWEPEDLLAAPPAPTARPAARATPEIDYGEGTIDASNAPTTANSTHAHTRNTSTAPLVPPGTTPREVGDGSSTPTIIPTRFSRNQMTYLKNVYFNQQRPEGGLPQMRFIMKSVTPGIALFLPVDVALRGVSRDLKLSVAEHKVAASTWADLHKMVEHAGDVQCVMVKDDLRIDCTLMAALGPPLSQNEAEVLLKWKAETSICKALKEGAGWVMRKMSTKKTARGSSSGERRSPEIRNMEIQRASGPIVPVGPLVNQDD